MGDFFCPPINSGLEKKERYHTLVRTALMSVVCIVFLFLVRVEYIAAILTVGRE